MKKPKFKKRSKAFFCQGAKDIAKNILGDYLTLKTKKQTLVGKIVETEAYLGICDDASHSFKGRVTPRNKIIYSQGGLIYVYLIYGKFWCFNIVVSKKDDPQAVFIRAIEPISGIEVMKERRGIEREEKLTNGPGRWTQSFSINKSFLGKEITSRDIFISSPESKDFTIVATKRIGVDYATKSKNLPLRFYIKNNPFVSKK